jgi:two-component system, OmpR family, sensor histidine kinase MtrB
MPPIPALPSIFAPRNKDTMTDQLSTTPMTRDMLPSVGPSPLEEFASTVAHELATPLAVIQMTTETALHLGDSLGAEEQRRLLDVIRRNSNLAVLLLRRLALARDVEAGTVTLDLGTVDLAQLVTESVDDLRIVVLDGHQVEMVVTDTPTIQADETALREITFNLLSNAAKYSGRHAPIEVAVDTTGNSARVAVRNHGSGVTPGHTEHIFEKFRQLDATSPGTGLGLFISRGLARAHGGDLVVRPATDAGSEFELRLPIPAR